MSLQTRLLSPSPGLSFTTRSQKSYQADENSIVSQVASNDISDLQDQGCIVLGGTLSQGNLIPEGDVDGENTIFFLPNRPNPSSVSLLLNGLRQRSPSDYTISENMVIFNIAPSQGDSIIIDYTF